MTQDGNQEKDHPGVIMKPPKIYALFLLAATLLKIFPGPNLLGWGTRFTLGILLLCLGFGLAAASIMRFINAGTNIPTDRPTTALVTDGTYRFSRNPIYIALTSLYLGLCFLFNLFWGFVFLVPLLYIMNRYVIEREENYLEKKFGDHYRDYKKSTRRWL